MRNLLALVFFAVSFSDPRPLQAQVVVTFKALPPGHDGQVQGVGRARYYLLNEYLKLAEFDSELFRLRADTKSLIDIETGLKKELEAKDVIIRTLESDKKILEDRSQRLNENWQKCEKALAACSPIWPYVVGILGASIGLVGFGIWVGIQ